MKRSNAARHRRDLLPEYDFRGGVRRKYVKRYTTGSNVVVLSPELSRIFPSSRAVNEALRAVVRLARKASKRK